MQTRARQGRFCVLRLSEQLKNPMKLRQKSVKNLVGFLGDLKTPKIHSEITWPLPLPTLHSTYIVRIYNFGSKKAPNTRTKKSTSVSVVKLKQKNDMSMCAVYSFFILSVFHSIFSFLIHTVTSQDWNLKEYHLFLILPSSLARGFIGTLNKTIFR